MYWVRGIVVSLAGFFLAYTIVSALVMGAWRFCGAKLAKLNATALYAMRVLPLACAAALVLLLAAPSYLFLEPRGMNERVGSAAWVLASAGALIVLAGAWNGARAWMRSSRIVSAWVERARSVTRAYGIRAYEVADENPLLFVAGVWRPKMVVSSGAVALLEPEEIRAGVQHEVAHVRRGDNLKKLLLHFCPLPWVASLEQEWMKAAEVAADDAAANDEETAVELASALIKMTRASAHTKAPELGMALVPATGASVSARVQRLLGGTREPQTRSRRLWWILLASALAIFLNYSYLFIKAHEAAELLMR